MSNAPPSVTVLGNIDRHGIQHSETHRARENVYNANLNIDADEFARRMDCLIMDAGFSPKRARFRALDEMSSLTREEMGDVFSVSKGTMDATAAAVKEEVTERTLGHYALFDYPMNFLAMAEFDAVSPADYTERFYFYNYSYANPEPRSPGPEPPRYRHCIICESLGHDDRRGYVVSDIDISRYASSEEAITDCYEDAYFWTEERATEWRDLLEFVFDSTVESAPEDRVNPDCRS